MRAVAHSWCSMGKRKKRRHASSTSSSSSSAHSGEATRGAAFFRYASRGKRRKLRRLLQADGSLVHATDGPSGTALHLVGDLGLAIDAPPIKVVVLLGAASTQGVPRPLLWPMAVRACPLRSQCVLDHQRCARAGKVHMSAPPP